MRRIGADLETKRLSRFCLLGLAIVTATPRVASATQFELAEHDGVIFTAKPGESVTLKNAKGKKVCSLKDGAHVRYIEDSAMSGGGDADATVHACDVDGVVPNARVLVADRLQRSPDGALATFSAVSTCGDGCHAELWLLGPDQRRILVTGNAGTEIKTTWTSDKLTIRSVSSVEGDDGPRESTTRYVVSLKALRSLQLAPSSNLEESARGALSIRDAAGVAHEIGKHR